MTLQDGLRADKEALSRGGRWSGGGVPGPVVYQHSLLTDEDLYLFNEGSHSCLADKLGSHPMTIDGAHGVMFGVWAPNAEQVFVIGDFNGWNRGSHPLHPRGHSGIWEGFIPGLRCATIYKYHIVSRYGGYRVDKADPFARYSEAAPCTGSVVWDPRYVWTDASWMAARGNRNSLSEAISIYELHLGSWKRVPEEGGRPLTYRELAVQLAEYAQRMGFTHVEFLPVMEHPFSGSWGYQTTGYFAPTNRFGSPQDFKFLINTLHQHGVGVILDWVPSHFPADEHGLGYFDGTHLYEHADPRQGFHPDWTSYIFNYGRHEVWSFLISSAFFWLREFHVDGLRVDAVASMLYLNYSRRQGEWIPNAYGGNENIDAIAFLRRLNEVVYQGFPDVQMVAEESTAWSMVSRPTYVGGLGFGLKWDMGWMHDMLSYIAKDPVHRRYHHNELTFRLLYAFTENFVLPLSHDEVVHGKGALLSKMPGDVWQRFANLRLLFGCMYGHAGKKLLFMGGEFGQWQEWNHEQSLDWHLLQYAPHTGMQRWVKDLNLAYRAENALHQMDCEAAGFEWVDCRDAQQSVVSFIRKGRSSSDIVLVVANFTPIARYNYRIGVPDAGFWAEILNSDAKEYGGSGHGNLGGCEAVPVASHGRACSLNLTLPPLGIVFFKHEGKRG